MDAALVLVITCATLSLISSTTIILTHLYFPVLRSKSAKLVVFLSVATAGFSSSVISALIYPSNPPMTTKGQNILGFFSTFFCLSTVFWSAAITKILLVVSMQRNVLLLMIQSYQYQRDIPTYEIERRRMMRFHLYVWLSAFVLSAICAASDSFESYKGIFYWFGNDLRSLLVGFLCYYVPIFSVTAASMFVWWRLEVLGSDGDFLSRDLRDLINALKYYPLVSFVVSIAVVIVEIVHLTNLKFSADTQWIYVVSAVLQQSQGIAQLIIYSRRPGVLQCWGSILQISRVPSSQEISAHVPPEGTKSSHDSGDLSNVCKSNDQDLKALYYTFTDSTTRSIMSQHSIDHETDSSSVAIKPSSSYSFYASSFVSKQSAHSLTAAAASAPAATLSSLSRDRMNSSDGDDGRRKPASSKKV